MINELQNFYLTQEEPNSSCLWVLRKIILNQHTQISEARKYGMPCFIYNKKAICYLWTDKKTKEPYILFVDGQHLSHDQLETGNRSRMKILRINPNQDIPLQTITDIITAVLGLHTK